MSNENNALLRKLEVMTALRTSEELYTLIALTTNQPFVQCDLETYDDVVYVYADFEDIKREGMRFIEAKHPVRVQKLTKDQLLIFYTHLYTMGVNCIVFNGFMENEYKLQLEDLVKRPAEAAPNGAKWVENASLHLTALYFMQELRRHNLRELTPELKELQAEIIEHFNKGTFVFAAGEDNRLPILKHPNGDVYLPIYTDLLEAGKFKSDQPIKLGVLPAAQIVKLLPAEAKGVVINPQGVNLQLPITKVPKTEAAPAPTEEN